MTMVTRPSKSDISSFHVFQAAIYWTALHLIENPEPNGKNIDAVITAAHSAIQNLPQPDSGLIKMAPDSVTLHGWFTSLWTLQEACLRPDMWICDRSFGQSWPMEPMKWVWTTY